jgi:type I restriction enzyme R subunit
MSPSQFHFLESEWPEIFKTALKVEELAISDPRTACFYGRRALEQAISWLFKHDPALTLPYQDHLAALIHEPSFQRLVGPAIFSKARLIKDLGNLAVHSQRPVRQHDSLTIVKELFHIMFWLTRTYTKVSRIYWKCFLLNSRVRNQ